MKASVSTRAWAKSLMEIFLWCGPNITVPRKRCSVYMYLFAFASSGGRYLRGQDSSACAGSIVYEHVCNY